MLRGLRYTTAIQLHARVLEKDTSRHQQCRLVMYVDIIHRERSRLRQQVADDVVYDALFVCRHPGTQLDAVIVVTAAVDVVVVVWCVVFVVVIRAPDVFRRLSCR